MATTSQVSLRRSADEEKLLSGVNKCPFDCLCSNNIDLDYKVDTAN